MGRTPCCSKDGMNKGAWTAEEDRILTNYIKNHSEGKWRNLPKQAGLKRCGKSCRLRWLNYLRPDIKRGNISEEEEDLIIRLHKLLGNRWSLIAGRLPGRTDNEVKNYWNTTLRKKVKLGLSPDQKSKEAIITNMISKQSPNKTQLATSTANNIHVQAINQGPNAVRTKPSECSNTEPVQEHENRKDVANTCEDNMSGGNLLNLDVPMDNFVAEEFLQSDISDSGHDFWKLCSVDHNHHEFDFNVINDQALLDGNNCHSVRSDGGRFPSSSCQPIFFPEDEMLMKYWTDFRDD